MDYHVFLLSRIKEHFDLTGRNGESVAVGLQSTAKIITGAAIIMVAVFGGFATGRLVILQQIGFGLAVAVFIDATIDPLGPGPGQHGPPRQVELVPADAGWAGCRTSTSRARRPPPSRSRRRRLSRPPRRKVTVEPASGD